MQYSTSLLLLLAGTGYAAPRSGASSLRPRDGAVEWDDSCNGDLPKNTKWGAAGFKTMKDVVQAAYTDTLSLAKKSKDAKDDNKGFTHYFKANQHDTFQKMMTAVGDEQHFSLRFVCVAKIDKDTKTACTSTSVMVTDSSPGQDSDRKTIEVCPKFFTGQSDYLLYNKDHTSPSPPYKDNSADGWCGKVRKGRGEDGNRSKAEAKDFVTVGHTLLHELTHLDSLGRSASVPKNKNDDGTEVQGTDDLKSLSTPKTAREVLAELKDDTPPEKGPICNAESYASAATEIYFMDLCGFSEISPKVETDQSQNCVLSPECNDPVGYAINPACTCTCNGERATLHDPGCQGFKGSLPDPPIGGAGSMNGSPDYDAK